MNGVINKMSKVSYVKTAYDEFIRDGCLKYGRIDLIIEHFRGADQIMRKGSIGRGKVFCKYIAGEALSDEEANVVYENGLRIFRNSMLCTFRIYNSGVINDKANGCIVRSTLGSEKPSV